MKIIKSNRTGKSYQIPEFPIEAVEQLEEFLIAEANHSRDSFTPLFIKTHFEICKKFIREMGMRK